MSSSNPPKASRNLAILHASIYDAVNGISRSRQHYFVPSTVPSSASKEAAAASAAHDVLVALYPDQKADLDAMLAASLAGITDTETKSKGIELGKRAAAEIIALRSNDGSNAPESYRPTTTPGVYVPTATPIESTSSKITPWAMSTGAKA